jgi:hypothetical protein
MKAFCPLASLCQMSAGAVLASVRNLASDSRSAASASLRAVMSLAAPNHSTISPCSSRIGTAREWVQPSVPSTRRTRCSRSKTRRSRMAEPIASMTRGWSSGSMYASSHEPLGRSVSSMNPCPSRWRISDQSGLIR